MLDKQIAKRKPRINPKALVQRLREYSHEAHAAAAWGFAGEGYIMGLAADYIEQNMDNWKEAPDGQNGPDPFY